MTSVLSPAQVVLVLWLLAAAAPTAAALLDATFLPIPIPGEECTPSGAAFASLSEDANEPPTIFPPGSIPVESRLQQPSLGHGVPAAPAFSILHTAVQRHLPRLI